MSARRLTLQPDPWNAWIYDSRRPDYNSPQAIHLRERRRAAIASCPDADAYTNELMEKTDERTQLTLR